MEHIPNIPNSAMESLEVTERLLNCEICGCKFFDIQDMALIGWDDTRPIYACPSCDAAAQVCGHEDC